MSAIMRWGEMASTLPNFFDWQSPATMIDAAEEHSRELESESLRRRGKEFREAFVAGRFAAIRRASSVRLLEPHGNKPTPDFAIRLADSELWFETTEIDRPGRRRGQEPPVVGCEYIPDEDWVTPEAYSSEVAKRVQSKAAKSYAKCDGLIIWSNAFPIEREDQLTSSWWADAAAPARDAFPEVWVHFQQSWILLYR